MSYRQLLANLEALPEEERQLAGGVYFFDEGGRRVCGCVLGKGLPELGKFVRPSLIDKRIDNLGDLPDAVFCGLTRDEAWNAQFENDTWGDGKYGEFENDPASRRLRYAHMAEWLRFRVGAEHEAPQAL